MQGLFTLFVISLGLYISVEGFESLPFTLEPGNEGEFVLDRPLPPLENTVYAGQVMYMIAYMESRKSWAKLVNNPDALHVDLHDYDELMHLSKTSPQQFSNVTGSTARGYFGMIFDALWDAIGIKKRVEWNEETTSWLGEVLDNMIDRDPLLRGLNTMHLELAILYLRNSATTRVVAQKSTYYRGHLKEELARMEKSGDFSRLWYILATNPMFTYSIWHRAQNATKTKYILTDNMVARISRIYKKEIGR